MDSSPNFDNPDNATYVPETRAPWVSSEVHLKEQRLIDALNGRLSPEEMTIDRIEWMSEEYVQIVTGEDDSYQKYLKQQGAAWVAANRYSYLR